ncbi:tetratricopeptide repeat protein [Chitinophaga sp. Cy-1792]|uniref:tetratricopeptide repeat protein n=1 Tax=Chitinophaga sp. Cy-1792 TaxID=2608339 RepID=UPI00141E75D6|nr:tetratricopeptide repeat protein [Chitinophaga sp. Cy-1792]NIG55404.1 hypothetical protein [Chitinophaga sp. Cy-1792]
MRYIPDLIPRDFSIKQDYFKKAVSTVTPFNKTKRVISIVIACIFFLFALANITHPPLFMLAVILGLGLLPGVHRWLEKKLRFKFTTKIKGGAYAIAFIPFLAAVSHFSAIDTNRRQEQLQHEKAITQQQALTAREDSLRKVTFYAAVSSLKEHQAKKDLSDNQINQLVSHLDSIAVQQTEKSDIATIKFTVQQEQSLKLLSGGKYQQALVILTDLLFTAPNDATLLYNRALCYDKLGNQELAVKDLKLAMEAGSTSAKTYHNKINPERKRVTGYVTRCCDGSTSSATGRGACSWHGGVCNWNEPQYETYRKYE